VSQYNGYIDKPPPAAIMKRFVPAAAKAVEAFEADPTHKNGLAIQEALARAEAKQKDVLAVIDGQLGERRARIGQMLKALDGELRGLSQDLGYRTWRANPIVGYQPATLSTGSQRTRETVSATQRLAHLHAIAASESGFVNLDRPLPTLQISDFAQPGRVRVKGDDYQLGAPGSEAYDPRIGR